MTDVDGESTPGDGVGHSRGQGHRWGEALHQVREKGKVAHVLGSQFDPGVAEIVNIWFFLTFWTQGNFLFVSLLNV